jgi:hypothetical protein
MRSLFNFLLLLLISILATLEKEIQTLANRMHESFGEASETFVVHLLQHLVRGIKRDVYPFHINVMNVL